MITPFGCMNSRKLQLALLSLVLFFPFVSLAQFTPLVGIPGVTDTSGPLNFSDYINTLYALSISIAGLLAVIKIIIAGVKYMLSDVVTSKQSAIGDIKGALLGLLIVMSAFLILYVINPELTKTNLFVTPISQAPANFAGSPGVVGGGPLPAPIKMATETSCPPSSPCVTFFDNCVADGGTPSRATGAFGGISDKIVCNYGNQTEISCNASGDPATACMEAVASCSKKRGSNYPHPTNNLKIICILPK
jgi:hypothetical protein